MSNALNNTLFQCMLDDLPDAIVVTNKQRIITAANKEVLIVFGYYPEELIGKELEVLLPSRLRQQHRTDASNYILHPEKRKMAGHRKVLGLKKDGSEFEADVALAPLVIEGETYTISSTRDITDKKDEERILSRQYKDLEDLNKELEKYSYTVSHDLKAPLQKIESLTNMLMDDVKEGKSQKELDHLTGYLKESINSAEKMISETLSAAKNRKESIENEKISLAELFNELHRLLAIPENFKMEISYDTPVVTGKRISLLQVFLNLMSNAIKYNDKKEGRIQLTCKDNGDHYLFTFSDNGKGIPGERLDSIFNLFQEDPSATDSHGIGLYTVKSIIEARGGVIHTESEAGKGTTFTFTWPKSIPA